MEQRQSHISLEENLLVRNLKTFLRFITEGDVDPKSVLQALQALNLCYQYERSTLVDQMGRQNVEYLEMMTYFLLTQATAFLNEAPALATVGLAHVTDSQGGKKRRPNFPLNITNVLEAWLAEHSAHPYPTEEEKLHLSNSLGISQKQINDWFINARRRKLRKQSK